MLGFNLFKRRASRKRSVSSPDQRRRRVVRLPVPPDQNIRLDGLKGESRHAVRNYDYARGVLLAMRRGVLGPDGIRLRSTLEDEAQRRAVESAWAKWGACCDSQGGMTWRAFELAVLDSLVIDGEAVVVVDSGGPWGYTLRLVDSVLLDSDANGARNGNAVSLGVERNNAGKVVAYHFTGLEPQWSLTGGYVRSGATRIAAERVLHVYEPDLPGQSRGIPLMATAIDRFRDLEDYEDSERTAARVAARKLGFIQTDAEADVADGDEDADEAVTVRTPAGSITHLDPGEVFQGWDPEHPNTAFGDFVAAQLRGAAAGCGLSYFELGNDLTGVNFSSGRIGLLAQRELWKMKQQLIIEKFHDKVFAGWLRQALLQDMIPGIPRHAFPQEIEPHRWVGRRYEHVQPREQATSDHQRIADGLSSRAEIIRSEGRDPDEVFSELVAENAKLSSGFEDEDEDGELTT